MKVFDTNLSMKAGFSRISRNAEWTSGNVFTQFGIVEVYSQGAAAYTDASRLDFIWRERLYTRNFDVRFSDRGLVMKAKQFAYEISMGNP